MTGDEGPARAAAPRKICVIALGGTISMQASAEGLVPVLGAGALAGMTDVAGRAQPDVEWRDHARVPSSAITFADLIGLAAEIRALSDSGVAGVIISQGTDTLEETAFALELLVGGGIDIVVTGAMRGASALSADGPANLSGALSFLMAAPGHGEVVILLDDCVHAARFAAKQHTTALSAFGSGEAGLRGRIHEGSFLPFNPPRPALPGLRPLPGAAGAVQVELVTLGLDPSGWIFEAPGHEHVQGWVIGAYGAGHVPERLVPVLERLAGKVPVILASRTGAGPICTGTYGYPGSERDLLARGLLSAGRLSPVKARVLLTLLLMEGGGDVRARFSSIAAAL